MIEVQQMVVVSTAHLPPYTLRKLLGLERPKLFWDVLVEPLHYGAFALHVPRSDQDYTEYDMESWANEICQAVHALKMSVRFDADGPLHPALPVYNHA